MIGKEVFFIQGHRVVPGIIVEVCESKRFNKYVVIFYDEEGVIQKRILKDSKFYKTDDLFGFTIDELIEKVKEEAEEYKDDLIELRKEFEAL